MFAVFCYLLSANHALRAASVLSQWQILVNSRGDFIWIDHPAHRHTIRKLLNASTITQQLRLRDWDYDCGSATTNAQRDFDCAYEQQTATVRCIFASSRTLNNDLNASLSVEPCGGAHICFWFWYGYGSRFRRVISTRMRISKALRLLLVSNRYRYAFVSGDLRTNGFARVSRPDL